MKHVKKERKKAVVIFERRSGDREVLIRNDNAFYAIEVKDSGKMSQIITSTDLGKSMAVAKKLLKEARSGA
jgi:hypothetical protein